MTSRCADPVGLLLQIERLPWPLWCNPTLVRVLWWRLVAEARP